MDKSIEDKVKDMKNQLKNAINKSMDDKSTLLFNSFARLLFFDTKKNWRDTYIFGPIAIIMDRVGESHLFG